MHGLVLLQCRGFKLESRQGRSQYEANRGTCLSHLRFDPGSVLFKHSHHKDPV